MKYIYNKYDDALTIWVLGFSSMRFSCITGIQVISFTTVNVQFDSALSLSILWIHRFNIFINPRVAINEAIN